MIIKSAVIEWLLHSNAEPFKHPVLKQVPQDLDKEILKKLNFWQQGCPVCALPGHTSQVCGKCLSEKKFVDATQSLLLLNETAKEMIHAFKYGGELYWSRVFAEMLAQRVDAEGVEALVAVPLHRNRLVDRGFNQSYEIAKMLSKQLGIPVITTGISRVIDTPHQTQLDRKQRQNNLKNSFEVDQNVLKGVKQIALIDDVMTTGATLEQLAKTLKQSCSRLRLQAWVVARAV